MMKIRARAIAVGLLLAAFTGVAAPTAFAGDGLCDRGYACIYKDLKYDGGVLGSALASKSLWGNLAWNDEATSVSANGGQCANSDFYEHAAHSNGRPYGDFFRMNSRSLMGSNYRDPDLRNGAGNKTGYDWNDRISGFTFTGC